MAYLLCADEPLELELSGTPADLLALSGEIVEFAQSGESDRVLTLDKFANPAPYSRCVETLILNRAIGPTCVSIAPDGTAHITGSTQNLLLLAKWLTFEEETPDGYHVHYEGWPGNAHVSEDSVPLVIQVSRSGPDCNC